MKEKKDRAYMELLQRYHLAADAAAGFFLIGLVFLINWNIQLKGLYMDDLYLWSCYADWPPFRFIFDLGSTRFRFVFNALAYVILGAVGPHVSWYLPVNLGLNGLLACSIYYMGFKVSGKRFAGLLCGICFAASRFSYYQINMVIGLMETFALWGAVSVLYFLFRYVNSEGEDNNGFILANLMYFLTCFTHERYMALLPLLLLAPLFKKRFAKELLPVLVFGMVLAIRYVAIGTLSPAGTGGTDVADTFSVQGALAHSFMQLGYLFGINTGYSIFDGVTWKDSALGIQVLVIAGVLLLAALLILFVAAVAVNKKQRGRRLCNTLLFLVFIAMCIGCSSVTIRVETRWVYSSYAGALLFAAYMWGVLAEEERLPAWAAVFGGIMFLGFTAVHLPVEIYNRANYNKLYYWEDQRRFNSLAEETYGVYGNELFEKRVIILGNQFELDDWTTETFFRSFHPDRILGGLTFEFADSARDFGLVTDNMVILAEDPKDKTYKNVTEFVRNYKFTRISGCYEDGWMDENSEFVLTAGKSGTITLSCYYPGELKGGETGFLYRDGKEILRLEMKQNQMIYTLHVDPYEVLHLELHNNFYTENAKEQRGEERMSMVVNITAE